MFLQIVSTLFLGAHRQKWHGKWKCLTLCTPVKAGQKKACQWTSLDAGDCPSAPGFWNPSGGHLSFSPLTSIYTPQIVEMINSIGLRGDSLSL